MQLALTRAKGNADRASALLVDERELGKLFVELESNGGLGNGGANGRLESKGDGKGSDGWDGDRRIRSVSDAKQALDMMQMAKSNFLMRLLNALCVLCRAVQRCSAVALLCSESTITTSCAFCVICSAPLEYPVRRPWLSHLVLNLRCCTGIQAGGLRGQAVPVPVSGARHRTRSGRGDARGA